MIEALPRSGGKEGERISIGGRPLFFWVLVGFSKERQDKREELEDWREVPARAYGKVCACGDS